MSARGPRRLQEPPRSNLREILLVFSTFSSTVFCVEILGFPWTHAMLEAIPPQSDRARARSARARAHPRLSNIAGARQGFLLLLLRCCLEMFETFSS